MQEYVNIAQRSYVDYWNYLRDGVLHPSWDNYFYWLLGLSVLVWGLELIAPWREDQKAFRRDFWLDGFYMFFNFFLFSLIGFNALSNVAVEVFNDFLALFGVTNLVAIHIDAWPGWSQLLLLFVLADLIQWNVHRMLHRVPWLWEFHKVHHSVKEMGFAAHLRFHWMESVIYKSVQYIPLSMIGFGIQEFIVVHMFTLLIGHLNHSNVNISWGPLKYVLNSPVMHIWHHAMELPADRKYGMNYGLSLSLWDYLFGTACIPKDGRDIELGFPGDDEFPRSFVPQVVWPLNKP